MKQTFILNIDGGCHYTFNDTVEIVDGIQYVKLKKFQGDEIIEVKIKLDTLKEENVLVNFEDKGGGNLFNVPFKVGNRKGLVIEHKEESNSVKVFFFDDKKIQRVYRKNGVYYFLGEDVKFIV